MVQTFSLPCMLVCFVLTTAWAGTGCGEAPETAPHVTVTWQIDPNPPDTGKAVVTVVLADSTGQPIEGADVAIEGIMTHPGMGPAVADAREIGPGRYETELTLTMAGDWIFLLEATLPDGRTLARQKDVPGVRAR